jgi:hypothetical protein
MLVTIAEVLTGLVGLFAVFLGVNAVRTPAALAGFGIPGTPTADPTFQAWLRVKAVRDVAAGLFTFVALGAAVLAGTPPHLLGWFMLAATVIPVGDALIVLRSNGPRPTAYGVHGTTAAAMLAISALLFIG